MYVFIYSSGREIVYTKVNMSASSSKYLDSLGPWNIKGIQEQRSIWTPNSKCGLINNFTRPQGKLPASEWLYKTDKTPMSLNTYLKSDSSFGGQ